MNAEQLREVRFFYELHHTAWIEAMLAAQKEDRRGYKRATALMKTLATRILRARKGYYSNLPH